MRCLQWPLSKVRIPNFFHIFIRVQIYVFFSTFKLNIVLLCICMPTAKFMGKIIKSMQDLLRQPGTINMKKRMRPISGLLNQTSFINVQGSKRSGTYIRSRSSYSLHSTSSATFIFKRPSFNSAFQFENIWRKIFLRGSSYTLEYSAF